MSHHQDQLLTDALAAGLTRREAGCLVLWSDGLTLAQVGHLEGIAESTAGHALARARHRLRVDTNAALLVAIAYRRLVG